MPVVLVKIYIQDIQSCVISHIISSTIHLVYLSAELKPLELQAMNLIIGVTGSVATIKLQLLIEEFLRKCLNV